MGWLLGCFKCTGEGEKAKPKKRLQSGLGNLVYGRSSSATVAHVTSPEDLHIIRKSLPGLAAASSNGRIEREPDDPLLSPLLDQAKAQRSANRVVRQDEDRAWSQEHDSVRELESFRERLGPDANTAKQFSDEVKFLRGCRNPLESPSNASRVTFDKSEPESTEQVDYVQYSWLVSSLVSRIQPGGLAIESCSRPNSPLVDLCEGGSVHCRDKLPSQSKSFDSFGDSNALKYAELSLFRLNLPSPPWTFSGTQANEKSSHSSEPSDNLLLEHLDLSSLIEDSALITNWELSSGSPFPERLGLPDLQVPSQDERKTFQNSPPSVHSKKSHSNSRSDAVLLDLDLNSSPFVPEALAENQLGLPAHACAEEVACSSNDLPDEAKSSRADYEVIQSEENSMQKDACCLSQVNGCVAAEERDSEFTSRSYFSSQISFSKRAWSISNESIFEKESNREERLQHEHCDDVPEALLTDFESSMLPDNDMLSHANYLALNEEGRKSYLSISSLAAKKLHNTIQGSYVEDETKLVENDNSGLAMFPHVEEDGEQRKKVKLADGRLSGRMHESTLVEDDQLPLLIAEALTDGFESSLEAKTESLRDDDSSAAKHELDESSFKQNPLLSFTFSSSSCAGTPPSVTSYRSSAKLADDRPILGTVAAHWSPISTRKWWDGKGIPNSTKKYQEDQKVSWHAMSFEERLEQALAKQDSVPSK